MQHRGCGVHIHIGANGHTPQTLRNLANIMASHENLLTNALAILTEHASTTTAERLTHTFLITSTEESQEQCRSLADIWYASHGAELRQNTALQRQPIPYAEPPRNLYKRHGRIQTFPIRCTLQTASKTASTQDSLKATFSFALHSVKWQKRLKPASPKPQQN